MNVRAISILGKSGYSTMLGFRSIFLTVVIICVFGLSGITQIVAIASSAAEQQASNAYLPFDGNKTTWHGFDRYDFIMDDATGAITPMTAPASEVTSFGIDVSLKDGKRRCVVVVPRKAAPSNPWSWRACYWDHQPQIEVELLRRGFHIAFVAPDPGRQGKAWDLWYKFLTENHGLAKKTVFIGMSKGGVNEFNWSVVNPDKVACIYADNPCLFDEDFAKIPELAKHDIPLLHVVGTEDWILRYTMTVEQIYHQWGGSITLIMKEGIAHHPHSLIDPTRIADWIEQHMHPVDANRPAFADSTYTKTHYYSLENSYIYLKEEDTYATVRGPGYVPSYDRYSRKGYSSPPANFREDDVSIVVPQKPAPGKPWVFMGDPIERDATVEQALLAKGYHIVIVPLEGTGMVQKQWDDIYKLLVDNGFSSKPVLKGTGAMAGEAYAWAIANPDKVSCIYARNPLMRSLMVKSPPIDNLSPLAKAGVPILHDCGSLDPWLNDQTRVVEKRYMELGGQITVIIREGEGHFPLAPRDPKTVVDFILSHQR
jgi:pimeloyl-ACP methyl ester carboxylesterase